ncbi:Endogenous Retrovirus Group Fc1 Member 1 Env Polyprotein [Manis pentadactyla]|nr:Endogenous Retrovirus Group Fc1 Member 1 Env Polyprotein [Manis pentadactyla]
MSKELGSPLHTLLHSLLRTHAIKDSVKISPLEAPFGSWVRTLLWDAELNGALSEQTHQREQDFQHETDFWLSLLQPHDNGESLRHKQSVCYLTPNTASPGLLSRGNPVEGFFNGLSHLDKNLTSNSSTEDMAELSTIPFSLHQISVHN